MDRVRIIVNEVINYKREDRLQAAYYKSLEGFFECIQSIASGYFFASPRSHSLGEKHLGRDGKAGAHCPSTETVRKMFEVAGLFVRQAEELLPGVVEIDAKLADALEREVSLVTGDKARIQPKILSPSLMFREGPPGSTGSGAYGSSVSALQTPKNRQFLFEPDKLFPQIPVSQLSLDFCSVLYNVLILLKRAHNLRHESPKNKSNALFLGALRSIHADLGKLQSQRDGLDHLITQAQDNLELLDLKPTVLAEQLSLIDAALFAHVKVVDELQFGGWIGRERRQRAKFITAMRELGGYISHWVTWEILKPTLDMSQRAKIIIHFIGVGECLAEMASYNMLAAIIRGLSTASVLRIGPLLQIVPKRSLISWDNLQSISADPVKQRALLSKSPSTCIPAFDTAYLLDLLAIEPENLCVKNAKFSKYCEALERFRLQSKRAYGLKFALHPALQHYLLTRPFLSSAELRAASHLVLAPDAAGVLVPEAAPIKPFHRRGLDEDERLFLPLSATAALVKEEEKINKAVEDEEQFSLGEQPETNFGSFYPLNDAEERAARINSIV